MASLLANAGFRRGPLGAEQLGVGVNQTHRLASWNQIRQNKAGEKQMGEEQRQNSQHTNPTKKKGKARCPKSENEK